MGDKNNREYLHSEEELDKIFEEAKSNKISKAVKKAKRFSTIKIIMISFITVIIVSIATISISNEISDQRWDEYIQKIKYRYVVQAPNKFPGMFYSYKGYFGGEIEHKTFKYINGKRVYTGTYGIQYNLLGENFPQGNGSFISNTNMNWEEQNYLPRYNDIGQELMVFYYPYVDYGNRYKNDLSLLEDIGDKKYMEIALSFDKEYSIDEVYNMIPKNLNLTWYWVDTVKDNDKKTKKQYTDKQNVGGKIVPVEQYPDLCYENDAYGIKTINEYGEKIESPEENFIQGLKEGEITHIYDIIAGADGKLTKEDIKIQGVVVTGDAESLKSLRNFTFIKASSIGVITDKY
ncbi:anti sigma factor C-terminal domain-containing protein [Inediibacterium massiliense]|uniref:anti sigma factor C-terminal domain-containing protein n=1 Tax=Inediibacterium massiliense TaxID=1658111 RepID=UPI0006B56120|nr:anti sigma factor C-terminal domain-containing protein [Inediibacterium massiliense]